VNDLSEVADGVDGEQMKGAMPITTSFFDNEWRAAAE
jgi:hypothetical protein